MADPKKINYAGGQTIDNSELVSQKIETAVTAETERATARETALENAITEEVARAQTAEEAIDNRLTEEIERAKSEERHIDDKVGDLEELKTDTQESTVAAINELVDELDTTNERLDEVLPYDEVPTEGSEKGAKSGGIFDAIRFASVKVGETMFWPVSEKETREVVSDNPFTFRFKGKDYSVEPVTPDTVDLIISKDIPDGWHALDGSVELEAAEYPDLAAFMPDNVTNDGKIWLPYVRQKIIKVKY